MAGGGGGGLFNLKLTALQQQFPALVALENHVGNFRPLMLRLHPKPVTWGSLGDSTKDQASVFNAPLRVPVSSQD